MNKFLIINNSCVNENVDVIVNAANRGLLAGGGVCGAIFSKAGLNELTKECAKYKTPLKDGEVAITSSCKITNCKAIIHAIGPDFRNTPNAFKELFDAYYNSLLTMKGFGYHSIAFPLISSGIFAGNLKNPVIESAKQCIRAYKDFVKNYPDYGIDVRLCCYSVSEYSEIINLSIGK